MKIYTNDSHEIIGYGPNYIPSEYSHEYEVSDNFVGNRSFPVMCGYKYEPQYELDFNEDGTMKYDENGDLVYKLVDGEKVFIGYGFFPFIDTRVLDRLQQQYDLGSKEFERLTAENNDLTLLMADMIGGVQ